MFLALVIHSYQKKKITPSWGQIPRYTSVNSSAFHSSQSESSADKLCNKLCVFDCPCTHPEPETKMILVWIVQPVTSWTEKRDRIRRFEERSLGFIKSEQLQPCGI